MPPSSSVAESTAVSAAGSMLHSSSSTAAGAAVQSNHASSGPSLAGKPPPTGVPAGVGAAKAMQAPPATGGYSVDLNALHALNQREVQSYAKENPRYQHRTPQQLYEYQHRTQQGMPGHEKTMQVPVGPALLEQQMHQQQPPPHHPSWQAQMQFRPSSTYSSGIPNGQRTMESIEQQLQVQAGSGAKPVSQEPLSSAHTSRGFHLDLKDLFKVPSSSIPDHNPGHVANDSYRQPGSAQGHQASSHALPHGTQHASANLQSSGGLAQTRHVDLSTLFSTFSTTS